MSHTNIFKRSGYVDLLQAQDCFFFSFRVKIFDTDGSRLNGQNKSYKIFAAVPAVGISRLFQAYTNNEIRSMQIGD